MLTCQDQPTAPDIPDVRLAPGGVPGKPPDKGKGKGKGGQIAQNFSLRFDGSPPSSRPGGADRSRDLHSLADNFNFNKEAYCSGGILCLGLEKRGVAADSEMA